MRSSEPAKEHKLSESAALAFEFVCALASELSEGKVELPSFPDIALRVQKVLGDDNVTPDRVVRIIGSEPALAARILTMSNSAALNAGGRQISELRTAISRMGFDMLRSAAITFAMAQLRKAEQFKSVEKAMNQLWQRSVHVAAMAYVIAKRHGKLSADTALLAGLLHGVGKLYILTRASKHPGLCADAAAYNQIVQDWHANIAKALLENWEMAEEIVDGVYGFEDTERDLRAPVALVDVVAAAYMFVSLHEEPALLESRLQESKVGPRLGIDRAAIEVINQESASEIAALKVALGS